MDWTTFRALAGAGAAEGIIRLTCTYADADGPSTEYFHVRGYYGPGMPSREFLTTEPHELALVKARLTTTGIQWAEYLAAEKGQPEQVRGFVLKLLWDTQKQPGSVHRVPPPSLSGEAAPTNAPAASDQDDGEGAGSQSEPPVEDEECIVETDEQVFPTELGIPQVDLYDGRVVNWMGKRLYLGRDTQISRLFWLLAKRPGVARSLGEVQRAVDGMETSREFANEETYQKAMNRVRKAISKLRDHLREHELDTHVFIVKEGPNDYPRYTLVLRFGKH